MTDPTAHPAPAPEAPPEAPAADLLYDPDFLEKAHRLRAAGVEPWPNGLVVSHTTADVRAAWGTEVAGFEDRATDVALGGRLMFRNRMGKALFLRIADRTGKLQVYVKKDVVGEATFEVLNGLDIGDFVWARGFVMVTRTGELSVQALQARLAGKTLFPFPDRWHGVTDVEQRTRQRYVDLFVNEESREVFKKRSATVRYLRDFFHERDFVEAETPMLQGIPGGATARPFVTHHNTFDVDLYLRVAPELYLKRLVVGGFERVFEINRNFRNEGVSVKHNPEFTMLEFYQAWATFHDLMDLTEELLRGLVPAVCGALSIPYGEHTLHFGEPFRRADMDLLISEQTGLPREQLRDVAAMTVYWQANHARANKSSVFPTTMGACWEALFDAFVEATLVQPTFVTGFPTEISPLSRKSDADPAVVDRFELYIAGRELANAFSELNDPEDQAGRFSAQVAARDAGNDESMHFDRDYVRALSYGMPCTAGEGLGIDRLVMLLTNRHSIREVILFPTLRPE